MKNITPALCLNFICYQYLLRVLNISKTLFWVVVLFVILLFSSISAQAITSTVSAEIPTGANTNPLGSALNKTTNLLYVVNRGGVGRDHISVVSAVDNKIIVNIPFAASAGRAKDIAINEATNKIYVFTTEEELVVINGNEQRIETYIPIETLTFTPQRIAVNKINNTVFVLGGSAVRVIDGATNSLLTTIEGFNNTTNVVFSGDATKAYVVDNRNNDLTVIDAINNTVITKIAIPIPLADSFDGISHVAINPVTNTIYVTNERFRSDNSFITAIDADTNSIITTFSAPAEKMLVNTLTNTLYARSSDSNSNPTITVVDGASNTVTAIIPVVTPFGTSKHFALNEMDNLIYVVTRTSNTTIGVTTINGVDNSSTLLSLDTNYTQSAAAIIERVVVNPLNSAIYVAGTNTDTLFVLNGPDTTPVQAPEVPLETVSGQIPNTVGGSKIVVDEENNRLYIADTSRSFNASSEIKVVDVVDNSLFTYALPSPPNDVAFNESMGTFNAIFSNSFSIYQHIPDFIGPTNQVIRQTGFGTSRFIIANENRLFITHPQNGILTSANASQGILVTGDELFPGVGAATPVGTPLDISINTITRQIYISDAVADSLVVVDGNIAGQALANEGDPEPFVSNAALVATIPLPSNPHKSASNTTTNMTYVVMSPQIGSTLGRVAVIDGNSNVVDDILMIDGVTPSSQIAVNSTTNKIYVTSRLGLYIIDGSNKRASRVPFNSTTLKISINPVTNRIYLLTAFSLTVLDGNTNYAYDIELAGYRSITDLAINELTNQIFVLSNLNDDVTIINGPPQPVIDAEPDMFSFTPQNNLQLSSLAISNSVTVSGINVEVPISITEGEYSINGGTFTSANGMVSNGNSVIVRHTTSSTPSTTVNTTVTIAGVSSIFSSTTAGDADGDGVLDNVDICPSIADPSQLDNDNDGLGDVCDPDDDNDLLTDIFELTNGLDPLDATGINGGSGDPDGDGFNNFDEQLAGSDASAGTGALSNPGAISFSVSTSSVDESIGVASVELVRTGGNVGAVSVNCFTNDFVVATTATPNNILVIPPVDFLIGSLLAQADYVSLGSGVSVNWPDGDSSSKTCNITIIDDSEIEADEDIQIDISNPTSGAKLGTLNTTLLTITDNDAAPPAKAINDFNGDIKSDIPLYRSDNGGVRVWEMDGGNITANTFSGALGSNFAIAGFADTNADGNADVIWVDASTGAVRIWLMNGGTVTNDVSVGSLGSPWTLAEVGDFNNDNQADILWYRADTGGVRLWLINNGTLQSNTFIGGLPTAWSISGLADVNGDNQQDIVWRNGTTSGVRVWQMAGSTLTNNAFIGSFADTNWTTSGFGDFNADGNDDLLFTNSSNGAVRVWAMNGTSLQTNQFVAVFPTVWGVQNIADYDNDGTDDIMWQHSTTGSIRLWPMNNNVLTANAFVGTFGNTDWLLRGHGDYDGGGMTDILWQNQATGAVRMWLMSGASIDSNLFVGGINPYVAQP